MTTRYTREHEWIRLDGDTATVGISDYAQEQLGDIVFVELPDVGKQLDKGAEAADFPGADRILAELRDGPARMRVGIRPEGRAPAREGTEVIGDGARVGVVTSGGFGPTVGGPVAMGYVTAAAAAPGTALTLSVRGKDIPAVVAPLPFVPHRYFRKPAT